MGLVGAPNRPRCLLGAAPPKSPQRRTRQLLSVLRLRGGLFRTGQLVRACGGHRSARHWCHPAAHGLLHVQEGERANAPRGRSAGLRSSPACRPPPPLLPLAAHPPLRSTPTTATGTMCPARAAERPCTLRRVYARPTPPLSAAQAAARVGSSRCDIRRQRREPHPDTIALAARHYQGQALRDRRLAWDEGRRVRSDAGRPWWTVQQR